MDRWMDKGLLQCTASAVDIGFNKAYLQQVSRLYLLTYLLTSGPKFTAIA